ncbi:MAG: RHS repeat-associated core domain-containing protein [Candidatus Cloacimonetes bacterium]|nr:RHS repeat-associated core domain-containing protein [Candidatus Cloacimonadota bacterium]
MTNISCYTWGLDLSGTIQGTGGVGGLLSDTKVVNSVTNTYFAVGDANGNITEYVDNIGAAKAHYEYSAVGEITAQSGSIADDFIHRFSTKPLDKKTRLVLYEYRPYDAPSARFITRDPIGERGGNPLYGFVGNDGVNRLDKLGLFSIRPVAGSPRVRTNSDGSFGGMWASVVILPDDNSFPLSGVVLHMKHTEIHVTKCDGTPVADFGSLSIEISLNCSSPFYDIRADGRGLDSKHWASRKGRINDEEGSEAYDGWYN